jgi:hypothetical protein
LKPPKKSPPDQITSGGELNLSSDFFYCLHRNHIRWLLFFLKVTTPHQAGIVTPKAYLRLYFRTSLRFPQTEAMYRLQDISLASGVRAQKDIHAGGEIQPLALDIAEVLYFD